MFSDSAASPLAFFSSSRTVSVSFGASARSFCICRTLSCSVFSLCRLLLVISSLRCFCLSSSAFRSVTVFSRLALSVESPSMIRESSDSLVSNLLRVCRCLSFSAACWRRRSSRASGLFRDPLSRSAIRFRSECSFSLAFWAASSNADFLSASSFFIAFSSVPVSWACSERSATSFERSDSGEGAGTSFGVVFGGAFAAGCSLLAVCVAALTNPLPGR